MVNSLIEALPLSRRLRQHKNVLWRLEVLAFLSLLVLPIFLDFFYIVFFTKVMILGMLALSFDINWGYSGIMSFGQALFFGAAAYAVALLSRDLGVSSIFVTVPVAALVGLMLAFLLAWFLLLGQRTPSIIFVALGTLTGSYAAERLVAGWTYIGAANGISSIRILTAGSFEFVEGVPFYYLAFGFLLVTYVLCRYLVRSQFGLVLAGIRQQEERLAFLGYQVGTFKAVVFSIAGLIAGIAGGLYAFHEGFAGPRILGIALSTQVVLYVLFGGAGTLLGGLIGVYAIEHGSLVLADLYKDVWPILLGILLLLVVVFRPTGLLGLIVSERERLGSYGIPAARRRSGGTRS
jgi:branched-chain amino acid transport system permease protein